MKPGKETIWPVAMGSLEERDEVSVHGWDISQSDIGDAFLCSVRRCNVDKVFNPLDGFAMLAI